MVEENEFSFSSSSILFGEMGFIRRRSPQVIPSYIDPLIFRSLCHRNSYDPLVVEAA